MYSALDADGSGDISWEEFHAGGRRVLPADTSDAEVGETPHCARGMPLCRARDCCWLVSVSSSLTPLLHGAAAADLQRCPQPQRRPAGPAPLYHRRAAAAAVQHETSPPGSMCLLAVVVVAVMMVVAAAAVATVAVAAAAAVVVVAVAASMAKVALGHHHSCGGRRRRHRGCRRRR